MSTQADTIGGAPAATGLRVGLWRRSPISSVRSLVVGGFGLLVLILAAVTIGAAWQQLVHQSDLADLEHHSKMASLLQNAEAQASISGLLLQRYVATGTEAYVAEINDHAAAAQQSLNAALAMGGPPGLDNVTSTGAQLEAGAARAAALREAGEEDEASAVMEEIVPVFRGYRLQLEDLASGELAQAASLRRTSDQAGRRAFFLLVLSGGIGVVLGVLASYKIARTIMRPLASLEQTALKASEGDLTARAATNGPRELAHLGSVLNKMMEVIEANTGDLERTNRELTKRNRDLVDARAQAATDPLTGLGNHRSFHKSLRDEFARAQETGTALGLIIIDVDRFKDVNDSMGHMAGDQALRDLSAALTRVVTKENTYRYGGDELAVLLPRAACGEARSVAERLRLAVSEIRAGETAGLSASLGVACFPESATTPEELVYRADMAMYWAKSTGKNRVTTWESVFEDNAPAATTPRHRVTPAQPGN